MEWNKNRLFLRYIYLLVIWELSRENFRCNSSSFWVRKVDLFWVK